MGAAAYLARAAAVACVMALAACAHGEAPAPRVEEGGLAVYGSADFDWELRELDGSPVRLSEYRDRVLFINLWATWCAPCVAELAGIERLRASLRSEDGVAFLIVAAEDADPVRSFLRRYDYDLPVLLEGTPMPEAFGLRALPTTFVVDRRGRIVLRHQGVAAWDRDAVRAFLMRLADA